MYVVKHLICHRQGFLSIFPFPSMLAITCTLTSHKDNRVFRPQILAISAWAVGLVHDLHSWVAFRPLIKILGKLHQPMMKISWLIDQAYPDLQAGHDYYHETSKDENPSLWSVMTTFIPNDLIGQTFTARWPHIILTNLLTKSLDLAFMKGEDLAPF